MVFLDFEVFKYDWLVVLADSDTNTVTKIWNSADQLEEYYNNHKDDIYIAYNMRGYDQFIFKGVLQGHNPKVINDYIIVQNKSGYSFDYEMNKIPLICYDVMPNIPVSLKVLEGFMGRNIHETGVSFDIERQLTAVEKAMTEEYCESDVKALIDVFVRRKDEFESHLSLVHTFNLPVTNLIKTKAQLSAEILECERVDFDDEWEIDIIPTLLITKYADVIDWFKRNRDYSCKLQKEIAGVPHIFAWGGLHGAKERYYANCEDDSMMLHVDVNSFYPAIMIEYGLLSRAVREPEKYRMIRDKRIEYKKAKNPLQAPYKIVLNSTYGICKDKYNKAYDPRRANEVCVNGQLLLLDLIEHLELVKGFELIQSNTDGLIIKIPESQFDRVDDVCYEWECRTGMTLGFDYITQIWQKDVNNYVFIDVDGKIERKGAYVKANNDLDNDMSIINTALVEYFINGTSVKDTIMKCTDMSKFQKIFKLTNKYLWAMHNGQKYENKVYRVYASKNEADTPLFKVKKKMQGYSSEKFANCPTHCFIENGTLDNEAIIKKLDKNWYVQLAEKRVQDYGCL